MKSPTRGSSFVRTGIALLAGAIFFAAPSLRAEDAAGGDQVTPVFQSQLANLRGQSLTAVVVTYAPGGRSVSHRHAGSVFAYVLSGEIRSQNSATGPARIYKVGESFFEPAGSAHLISENASTTEPASLLAIFVAEDKARLTVFDK